MLNKNQIPHLTLPTLTQALVPQVVPGLNTRALLDDASDTIDNGNSTVPDMQTLKSKYIQSIRARTTLIPVLNHMIRKVECDFSKIDVKDPTQFKLIQDYKKRIERLKKTRSRILNKDLMKRFNGIMSSFEMEDDACKKMESTIKSRMPLKNLPVDFQTSQPKSRRQIAIDAGVETGGSVVLTNVSTPAPVVKTSRNIAANFREVMEGRIAPVTVLPNDSCPYGHGPLVEVLHKNFIKCQEPVCHYSRVVYKSTTENLPYGKPVEISTGVYVPTGHLTDRMADMLGRRTAKKVTFKHYDNICRGAFKAGIPLYMMDVAAVSTLMKRFKYNSLYKCEFSIASKITGLPMPHLTSTQVKHIEMIHKVLKEPYDQAKKDGLTSKKNYYGFNFIMHKICIMLGLVEYIPGFPLQSGILNRKKVENLYKIGCETYGFEVISSFVYDERADPERLMALARLKRHEDKKKLMDKK